jgi:hypothetical protein
MNRMTTAQTSSVYDYQQAVDLLRAERRQEACGVLAGILARDPADERAWDLLSYVLTDPARQVYALRQVVRINPQNAAAWARLVDLAREMPAPAAAPDSESSPGLDPAAEDSEPPANLSQPADWHPG